MTGVLVLAAGSSSRMGRAKQLLPYRGTTLLRHTVETALATGLGPALIVLGAQAEACREALGEMEVRTIVNSDWDKGMGTSIRAGVGELELLAPRMEGILIMLHDQPAIPAQRLAALVAARRDEDLAVASRYDDIAGVPAWFRRDLFAELRQLDGAQGAQKVLRAHAAQVRRFEMPEARFDIDTPEDYERICGNDGPGAP